MRILSAVFGHKIGMGARGIRRLWANKALEGQAIVHSQGLAPPMLLSPQSLPTPLSDGSRIIYMYVHFIDAVIIHIISADFGICECNSKMMQIISKVQSKVTLYHDNYPSSFKIFFFLWVLGKKCGLFSGVQILWIHAIFIELSTLF